MTAYVDVPFRFVVVYECEGRQISHLKQGPRVFGMFDSREEAMEEAVEYWNVMYGHDPLIQEIGGFCSDSQWGKVTDGDAKGTVWVTQCPERDRSGDGGQVVVAKIEPKDSEAGVAATILPRVATGERPTEGGGEIVQFPTK